MIYPTEEGPELWLALDWAEQLALARAAGDMRLAEDCRIGLRALHSASETGQYAIAVDFDGILCKKQGSHIGDPRREIIGYLKMLRENYQVRLILRTHREGEQYLLAREWCHAHGLAFDAYNENLPEYIERFGEERRMIFADEYWYHRGVRIAGGDG